MYIFSYIDKKWNMISRRDNKEFKLIKHRKQVRTEKKVIIQIRVKNLSVFQIKFLIHENKTKPNPLKTNEKLTMELRKFMIHTTEDSVV